MRRTLRFLFLFLFAPGLQAQQDAMFTKYVFNSLIFNPAVAGGNDHLTLNLIHRQQWLGFEGAPSTQSFSIHSPLVEGRAGAGLSIVNDKAGAMGRLDLYGSYAYHIPVGKQLKLSIGMQAGFTNWRGDWTSLTVEQNDDAVFRKNTSRWLPNFGVGFLLAGPRFYAGISCPRLVENRLTKTSPGSIDSTAREYQHYYLTAGAAFPLRGDNLVFRPSVLLKSVGLFSGSGSDARSINVSAPTEIDLDASLFIIKTFWVGAAYRTALAGKSSNDSVDFWAAWHLRDGLRFGAAYDVTLSDLRKAGNGSFELMLGYEFDIKVRKAASPRFF